MPKPTRPALVPAQPDRRTLLPDLRHLILTAREQVARAVDSTLVALNWEIGHRIRRDILKERRAAYGTQIVSTVSRQLEPEFGRGFDEKSLRHMIRFAEVFPDEEIVSALRRQLSWTHFNEKPDRGPKVVKRTKSGQAAHFPQAHSAVASESALNQPPRTRAKVICSKAG